MTTPEYCKLIQAYPLDVLVDEHQACTERLREKDARAKAYAIEKEMVRRAYRAAGKVPAVAPRVSFEPAHPRT